MSFSIQTNVNSLIAQENLNTTALFQSQTIEQLTSGYRINSSGDDAAGLAVANQLAGNTAELTQGVLNANNSISQLQTIDGGLSNISTIIDRLRTLATESASSTFTGDRTTLNTEYQGLLGEITRQASNINLNTGGVSNADLTTYIGGGNNQANAQISVDLSGASNAVDATALGLSSTSVIGGGSNDISGAVTDLRSGTYLAAGTQQFTLNTGSGTITATVGNGNTAVTGQQAVDQLNQAFNALGITASIDSTTGQLSFSGGSTPYTVNAAAPSAGSGIAATNGNASNNSLYAIHGPGSFVTETGVEDLAFTINGTTTTVNVASGSTLAAAQSQINTALAGQGITAVLNAAGTNLDFQADGAFNITETANLNGATGVFAAATNTDSTAPAASATATGNALQALTQITKAVQSLGLTQGIVGAGENKLQYAVNLAQSQITSFSSSESQIKDADIATEAANLTKAQVLQQTGIAALAQANSAPQAILKLLQ